MHRVAVGGPDSDAPNWHKAVKVMAALFRQLQASFDKGEYNLMLNLFLKTAAPYFREGGGEGLAKCDLAYYCFLFNVTK